MLNTVGMLDTNKKITPAATTPLGIGDYGPPFDKPWEHAYFMGMLIYISRNYRTGVQFAVHQCANFTHNPRKIRVEAINNIFCFLVGTQGKGSSFDTNSDTEMDCYVDTDFSRLFKNEYDQYPVCVKSRTGYVMTIGECKLHCV